MKKFNISKPEQYTDKQGVEKTYWNNVGTYTEFEKKDGSVSRLVEIPAIGLKAQVFLIVPKEQTQTKVKTPEQEVDELSEDINPEDIPF